ncbi:MAG TPA: ABC-2 family transporter protein [Thermomicrobiales bacterium]|nr:ABC-2 family transporter protein [Thermomicrobiales bacterium]
MADSASLPQEFRIALRIAGIRLRGQMAYRASFWMQIVSNFIIHFAEVMALFAMFYRFDNMGGWTLGDVAFLHGISMLAFSLGDTIAVGLDSVPGQIRLGEFDSVLIRPLSSWVQAIVSEVSLRHLGQLIQGALILAFSFTIVDIEWTVAKAAMLIVAIITGVALYIGLFTVVAILSFWTVNSIEAVNAFTYGGSDLAQFPLHIFQRWMRSLFMFVIPVAFTAYFPALFILDKDDPLGFPHWVRFIGPIPVAIFCLVVAWGWRQGIRHYRSTGS